jgi:outer membrane receptor protein involved in Fe transport
MPYKNYTLLYVITAVLTLGIAGGLSPVNAQEDDKDVYTLSPFTIDETENVGYLARSSLAGTRLKAPLRDIAATISVITEEFMKDTGSNDLQELLVYTANTEILGIGGNFANPNESRSVGGVLDSQFTRPTTNTRVRGLAAADLTRNYFPTIIAMDSYNTNRVVINRGANAILFGLGSPAGIINNQTIAPIFEDHTEISFQIGSYESQRGELDVERVLIEDKLSLRVAVLNEEQFYQAKPAFEHDKRVTAVTEWRPLENTTLRLSYESGSITANRPRQIPPQDMVSRWFDVSPTGKAKPTHNPSEAFQLFFL